MEDLDEAILFSIAKLSAFARKDTLIGQRRRTTLQFIFLIGTFSSRRSSTLTTLLSLTRKPSTFVRKDTLVDHRL